MRDVVYNIVKALEAVSISHQSPFLPLIGRVRMNPLHPSWLLLGNAQSVCGLPLFPRIGAPGISAEKMICSSGPQTLAGPKT